MVIIQALDRSIGENVGLTFILDELRVISPYGKYEKSKLQLYQPEEKESLIKELGYVEALVQSLKHEKATWINIEGIMERLKDVKCLIEGLTSHIVLDEVALFEIKYFTILAQEVRRNVKGLDISMDVRFMDMLHVIKLLDPEDKGVQSFYIYDTYDPELETIRKEKISIEKEIFSEDNLDNIEALKVKRLALVVQEDILTTAIRKQLSAQLYQFKSQLIHNMDTMGRLDILRAKGELAIKYKATKPVVEETLNMVIKEARHPEVMAYLERKQKSFVPININLIEGVTIITGANMGGKSVALKTIMLNMLLAHMGFFVFAQEIRFSILNYMCYISDDMQSVSRGISTFGAEILSINKMVEGIKDGKGFVILDEFARGTNPREGVLLVRALCKFLKGYHTISLLATHYDGIVDKDMTHYQVIGLRYLEKDILRAIMNSNPEKAIGHIQEKMDFNLELVSEDAIVPKEALTVAELLGLDDEIIAIARDLGNVEI